MTRIIYSGGECIESLDRVFQRKIKPFKCREDVSVTVAREHEVGLVFFMPEDLHIGSKTMEYRTSNLSQRFACVDARCCEMAELRSKVRETCSRK